MDRNLSDSVGITSTIPVPNLAWRPKIMASAWEVVEDLVPRKEALVMFLLASSNPIRENREVTTSGEIPRRLQGRMYPGKHIRVTNRARNLGSTPTPAASIKR